MSQFNVKSTQLIGSGGGGKGGSGGTRTPFEASDTLRSKSFARVLDLISEGEIEGIIDSDGNPLIDAVQLHQPNVVGGVIQPNAIGFTNYPTEPGNRGYRIDATHSIPITFTNVGAGTGAIADVIIEDGVVTAIKVTNGGTGYNVDTKFYLPPVIGLGIFVDDVPVQNEKDLSFSFPEVEMAFRAGTQDQDVIGGFEEASEVVSFQTIIKHAASLIVAHKVSYADAVIIAISLQGLYSVQNNGDVLGSDVTYSVYVTYHGDSLNGDTTDFPEKLLLRDTITGKASSVYLRSTEVLLDKDPNRDYHNWTFRFVREDLDSTSLREVNEISLEYLNFITHTPYRYPNSALCGIKVNAERFRKVPVRAFEVKGLRIEVPDNYFPDTEALCVYENGAPAGGLGDELNNGLMAYYKLDDVSLVDSSGNGNTLNNQGNCLPAAGQVGGAVGFNGTLQYLWAPFSPSLTLNPTDSFSAVFWVYAQNTNGELLGQYSDSGFDSTFAITLLSGSIRYQQRLASGPFIIQKALGALNTWHLVIAVYDRAAGTFRLRIDNQTALINSIPVGSLLTLTDGKLWVGNRGSISIFKGRMDEVALYKRALITEEEEIFWNDGIGVTKGTQLIRHFKRTYNRRPDGKAVINSIGNPVDQVWNGNFYIAWSDNPAWCYRDLITNTRYGLGRYIGPTVPDKWGLYTVARYCDELVPSGYNVELEPRFTCNLYLQVREEAWKVVQDFTSIFRGMTYWSSGAIVATQDSPKQVFKHFTNASVTEGTFNYPGTALKARHTVVIVRYNDPLDSYRPKYEYVEDQDGIIRFGIRELELTAFGCTSRGQARRLGRWVLISEREETDTVIFKTGFEALALRPGDIFSVSDNARSGLQYAGRILNISSDRKKIFTDRHEELTGTGYRVVVSRPQAIVSPTNSTENKPERTPQILELNLYSFDFDELGNLILFLEYPLPIEVEVGGVWGLSSGQLALQKFRTISVVELAANEVEVTGLAYREEKFDVVDKEANFDTIPITVLPRNFLYPTPPRDLFYVSDGIFSGIPVPIQHISLYWTPPESGFVASYEVHIREGLGNYHLFSSVTATTASIPINSYGDYSFAVYAVGVSGLKSQPAKLENISLIGNLPGNLSRDDRITGLEILGQGNDNVWIAADLNLAWRINSPSTSYEIGSEPTGANSGGHSPTFDHYDVLLFDPLNPSSTDLAKNRLLQTFNAGSTPIFGLTSSMIRALNPLGLRDLIVEVQAHKRFFNNFFDEEGSAHQIIRVTNEKPPVPTLNSVSSPVGEIVFVFDTSNLEVDFAGFRIFFSLTNGFTPSAINMGFTGNPGSGRVVVRILPGTWYYRYAQIDTVAYDPLDCILSSQGSIVVS